MSNVRLKKGKKKERKDTTAERGPERKRIPPLYSGGRHEPITLWPESPDTETEHRRALKRLLASTATRVPGNTASRSRERNTRYCTQVFCSFICCSGGQRLSQLRISACQALQCFFPLQLLMHPLIYADKQSHKCLMQSLPWPLIQCTWQNKYSAFSGMQLFSSALASGSRHCTLRCGASWTLMRRTSTGRLGLAT